MVGRTELKLFHFLYLRPSQSVSVCFGNYKGLYQVQWACSWQNVRSLSVTSLCHTHVALMTSMSGRKLQGKKVETRAPGAHTDQLSLNLFSTMLHPVAGWVSWRNPWSEIEVEFDLFYPDFKLLATGWDQVPSPPEQCYTPSQQKSWWGVWGKRRRQQRNPCPSPSVILLWPASCLLTHTSFSTKALHSQPTLHTLTQNHSTTLHLLQFQVQECQRLRWCWVMLLWVSRR